MRWLPLAAFLAGAAANAAAPVLDIETRSDADGTGTMHYVDDLRISVGGAAPLVLASDVGGGVLRPIPGPQYAVGEHDVVLLGWSSSGGGMQTMHALLLHIDGDSVALSRELTFTGDRSQTALLIRRDGPDRLLLGVPEPTDMVHAEDDWSLQLSADTGELFKMEQIRIPPFVDVARLASDFLYSSPASRVTCSPRVAWISADATGFSVSATSR